MKKTYLMILAFVFSAIVISLLLPSRHTLTFNSTQGDIWSDGDLVAEFSFPIVKSDQEYQRDIKDAKERFSPIYAIIDEVDDGVKELVALSLSSYDYHTQTIEESDEFKRDVALMLDSIYSVGIINNTNQETQPTSKRRFIRVVDNGEISLVSINSLHTLEEARELFKTWLNGYLTPKESVELYGYITENVVYDPLLSSTDMEEMLTTISHTKGLVPAGSVIVKESSIITASSRQILDSYKQEYELRNGEDNSWTLLLGNFVYVFIILAISYSFLSNFRREFSKRLGNVLFILFIYILMVVLSFTVSKFENASLYVIPYIIVPFYVVTFYDIRMSIFEYIAVLFLCAPFSQAPVEFMFINLFSGLAGIFIMQNSYNRKKLFVAVGGMFAAYNLSFVAISLMNEPNVSHVSWSTLVWFPLNLILFLALYQLVYLLEKVFGFVTDITLYELCDTNHFLLRELAEKSPGTFQHSIQVANLAEAAAKEIGANPLYARTGALYHDIGKTENPYYFIENSTSLTNPHDKLDPLESVKIIKRHVSDGVMLAYRHNLPSVLIDFITSHHAKSVVYYFYHQYINSNKDSGSGESSDEITKMFSYDGPAPVSKEASICMMADSVEAASRSLKTYTPETISNLVDSVVNVQLSEGSFEASKLSYADIMKVKEVFKSKIERIYHVRIEYPTRK